MRKIRGPIQRIDMPSIPRAGSRLMPGPFFRRNGMFREFFRDARNNSFLGTFVRLRHQIHFIAFVANVGRTREFLTQDLSRFAGDLQRGIKIIG